MKLIKLCRQYCKPLDAKPLPSSVWTNPVHFIGCGFGIGSLPFMPGTYATLFAILIYLLIAPLHWFSYTLICVVLNLAGVWLCDTTNRDFGEKDHPGVCYDEIAAFPICLIGIPFSWYFILAAFVLFRLLDIIKPTPINLIEKHVPGGWGVMLDDIAAALIILAILHIALYFL